MVSGLGFQPFANRFSGGFHKLRARVNRSMHVQYAYDLKSVVFSSKIRGPFSGESLGKDYSIL